MLVVPAEMTVEEYIAQKAAAGELDPMPPMRDVTPAPRNFLPEPLEHLPEAPVPGSREPAPRPVPSGTTIAPFPGPRTRRGD